jgi:hypothetical protein
MDISKLPKLSKTSESQSPPDPIEEPIQPPAFPPITYNVVAASSIGLAEAWISIGLGILLLFIFPNTIRYFHSPADFEQNNPVTDAQGNAISYPKSVFFLEDLGVTVFAAALLLEGIALVAIRKIGPLWIAFAVTVAATVFNIVVIARVYPVNGFQLINGVGVVILGYMALTQWRLISLLRR